MDEEFKKLHNYLKRLRDRLFNTYCAFYVYEALRESRAPNVVGEKIASENNKLRGNFLYFFSTSEEALRVYFLLELAKFFEASQKGLHINALVNIAQNNIGKLTKEDFLKFHQERQFIEELFQDYEAINNEDLNRVRTQMLENSELLKRLSDHRDKYLAHDDKMKDDVKITVDEVKTLFRIAEEILSLFDSRLDFSTTAYDHVKEVCKGDVNSVIDYLKRFELYRIKEIEEKYKN